MPSLNDLGEFKFSFNRIALGKDSDGEPKKLPYDDLPLPTVEATPMTFPSHTASEESTGDFDIGAFIDGLTTDDAPPPLDVPSVDFDLNTLLQESPPVEESGADSEFDLNALLQDTDAVPDMSAAEDAGAEDSAEEPSADFDMDSLLQDTSADAGAEDSAEEPSADFDMDSLLQDTSADAGAEDSAEEPSADFDIDSLLQDTSADAGVEDTAEEPSADFDMDSLLQDTSADAGAEDSEVDEIGGIDLGGESLEGDFGSPPQSDVMQPEVLQPLVAEEAEIPDDFNIDGLDLGSEEPAPSSGAEIFDDSIDPNEGIDMGGELSDALSADLPVDDIFSSDDILPDSDSTNIDFGDAGVSDSDFDTPLSEAPLSEAPAIDLGADLGSDFASDSIELGSESDNELSTSKESLDSLESFDSGGGFGDSSDFALDGLDEIFDKSKIEVPVAAPKRSFFRRKKRIEEELPEAEADIEEIQLTQGELDKLLKTIASYPLNLRIACEELIAEQVILPQQLSRLIRLLIRGANVREAAALVEEITGKPVIIPKSYEKMTGAAFEAEQASFAYIFIHNFLPVLRLFAIIAAFIASVIYLGYKFVYIPIKAENLYKRGYERISAGEYSRANELFHEAFLTHRKKKWFYAYAEAFRDQRRYMLAEQKYDELLRYYPRDKKGVLDYAYMQTYYLMNYDKANTLLQQQLLDYAPNDREGLLAAGDNFLLWADSDPSRFYDKYEDARFCYARLLELGGWQVPVVERMMMYFIRTDNLKEVIYLRRWFDESNKRKLSPASVAELGGYLLDKQLEEVKGVPDAYLDNIESVRAMLLQAVMEEPTLPEPHYHLARYHHNLGNTYDERLTLENAIRAFDLAKTETVRRRLYRVDTHYRYSNLLVNNREFFPAEEQAVKGIQLYEDYLNRNLIRAVPANAHLPLGKLYAAKGDLEYFVKSGDMEAALGDYHKAERYGYAPPEVLYRMGSAYYQQRDWGNAISYLFKASADLPLNRRMLHALGNAAYQRGDYFAAQGYYDRLLDILDNQRISLTVRLPNNDPNFLELGERLMMARNNAGVVYQALGEQTGNREYRSRAMGLYAESSRAWDSITRDPQSMVRMRLTDAPGTPSINLGYLNANNALRPVPEYTPQIFPRIDKDVLEPSRWEELAPVGGLQ